MLFYKGTGKTVLIRSLISQLRNSNKKVAVTATTGLAAAQIDGTTVHKFSAVGTGMLDQAQYGEMILNDKQRDIIR